MNITSLFLRSLLLAGMFSAQGSSLGAGEGQPLSRATPESQGVSSRNILSLVAAFEQRIDALHSLMIVRHGRVIAEGWWRPYAAHESHEMYSLTKSFTSTAVGFAVAEGRVRLDDPVLKFFPQSVPMNPGVNLRALRVRDLLTMSTGHHAEDLADFPYDSDDPVARFLALPLAHKPGTLFVYNTPASFLLSALVQRVTGQTVREYLRPRLFAPLGIGEAEWDATRGGVSVGGFGLHLRTEDVARFGLLYLQHGRWEGKQVLPAGWAEEAVARWMSNGSNPASDWDQGYGFQFWRCRHGALRGDGAHGQFCVMLPAQDTVVAITAGTRDLQGVLNVLWDELLPALSSTTPLAEDAAGTALLRARLANLALKTPVPDPAARPTPALAGARFVFAANNPGLRALQFFALPGDRLVPRFTVAVEGEDYSVEPGHETWVGVSARRPAGEPGQERRTALAVAGAWTGSATYTATFVRVATPFVMRVEFAFLDDQVTAKFSPNVGPAPAAAIGRRSVAP